MTTKSTKVLVSVWNDFYGPQLSDGLAKAGFEVTYHHTGNKKPTNARCVRNWPAAFLNRAGFKGWMKQEFAFSMSRRIVETWAERMCKHHDVFWGFSGCSLRPIRKACGLGIPALLERGSTHCEWQKEVLHHQFLRYRLENLLHYPTSQIEYEKLEYRGATRICVPSKYVAETFIHKGVSLEKISRNPYGVDFDFWSQSSLPTPIRKPLTFLYLASIGLRKGIGDLLQAWRIADLTDCELLLVGGISNDAISLMQNLPANVKHRGFTPPKIYKEFMGSSIAYILPSFEEGMARSVLESAAAGLPPIITEETGATDILRDGRDCWVIPSGSPETLASVLKEVAAKPEEASKRGLNAQAAVRNYTWEAYGDRSAKLLSALICKP